MQLSQNRDIFQFCSIPAEFSNTACYFQTEEPVKQ